MGYNNLIKLVCYEIYLERLAWFWVGKYTC